MQNNRTLFSGRSLFPFFVYMVIFSVVKLGFDHRAISSVRDLSVANEDPTPKGVLASLNGFVRQRELAIPSSDEGDDDHNHDNTGSEVCLQVEGKSESSFQRVWKRLKPSITNVSLINTDWTKNIRAMKNFTDWVDNSMSYFTYSRLQHTSISRPIDQTRSIGRVRSILEEKLRNPMTAPPLRIVVFGGSVTNGHYCLDNIFNFPVRTDGKGNDRAGTPAHQSKICAWSGRLQDMMDATFGHGVVDIKNLAVGGAKSDMSTALMEFGLIPDSTPDIIIWDHGINDAMTTVNPNVKFYKSSSLNAEQIFEKLQKFYQAAMALPTSCDNPDPPLVILLDSFIGQQSRFPQISEALRISTAVSKMLTWYPNIWGISSANTIRPYILTNVNDQHKMIGLLGTNGVVTHPGMMYHISIAWIVMFNFLNVLHDSCVTSEISANEDLLSEQSNRSTVDKDEYHHLSYLPELQNKLRMIDVPKKWKQRIPEPIEYEKCIENQVAHKEATKKFTKDSSLTCFYAWIVNTVLKVDSPQQIYRKIKPYLVKNEGWSAYSTDALAKPGGWIPPGGRGSFFELKFNDVPITVDSLTIIYMQSYSQMWINSTVHIDCTFYNPSMKLNTKQVDQEIARFLRQNDTIGMIQRAESYSTISHRISGYHDEETSILVPIKLPLPDRTTIEGKSTLRLHFRLLDGQTFKIAGIALC